MDATGFSLAGSFSVSPKIAINVLYGSADYDRVGGLDIDSSDLGFGITAHTPIATNTDVFAGFMLVKGEFEVSGSFGSGSEDDNGNAIALGLRHMATDSTEIEVGFTRLDIFDETTNSFDIGARFYASDKFSIGIGYGTGDDVDAFLIDGRIDIK